MSASLAELAFTDPNLVQRTEEDLSVIKFELGGIAMVDGSTPDRPDDSDESEIEVLPHTGVAEHASHASLELGRIATGVIIGKAEKIEGTEGFYNPAVWTYVDENGATNICLLGRDIEMVAEEATHDQELTAEGEPIIGGGPDVGPIVLKVLGPDGKIIPELTKVMWEPKVGEPSYEDFRALLLDDGRLIFGLTWVEPDGTPYPAIFITTHEAVMKGAPIEPQIVRVFGSGDQTTPLDEEAVNDEEGVKLPGKGNTWIDPQSFMFRQQGKENRHRLRVFNVEEGVVTHRQYIELPKDKKWGIWAMGPCGSPEWTDDTRREAFTLIHGITINGDFVYAAASARLFRDQDGLLAIDNVDDEPLLTSALFENVVQRHKGRNSLYTVGQVAHRDEEGNLVRLDVICSPGDSRTDRVSLDLRKKIRDWKRPELTIPA